MVTYDPADLHPDNLKLEMLIRVLAGLLLIIAAFIKNKMFQAIMPYFGLGLLVAFIAKTS